MDFFYSPATFMVEQLASFRFGLEQSRSQRRPQAESQPIVSFNLGHQADFPIIVCFFGQGRVCGAGNL